MLAGSVKNVFLTCVLQKVHPAFVIWPKSETQTEKGKIQKLSGAMSPNIYLTKDNSYKIESTHLYFMFQTREVPISSIAIEIPSLDSSSGRCDSASFCLLTLKQFRIPLITLHKNLKRIQIKVHDDKFFFTFGSTILPRLPTSLCFSTFCNRNFRFFSDFQFYLENHHIQFSVEHIHRSSLCQTITYKNQQQIV